MQIPLPDGFALSAPNIAHPAGVLLWVEMAWFRVDSNFRHHPKFRRIGIWGVNAVLAAWEMAKEYGRTDGNVTDFWDIETVSEWLAVGANDSVTLRNGMLLAEKHGLIDTRKDGVYIHDWASFQSDASNAERQQRYRDRRKGNKNVTGRNGRVTPRYNSNGTEHNIHNRTEHTEHTEQNGTEISADALALATELINHVIAVNPASKLSVQKNRTAAEKRFARDMDLLLRVDGRTLQHARDVMAWTFLDSPDWSNGSSWRANIQSATKFREKYDTLALQMSAAKPKTRTAWPEPTPCDHSHDTTPEERGETWVYDL